jgi:hypothetical protein
MLQEQKLQEQKLQEQHKARQKLEEDDFSTHRLCCR